MAILREIKEEIRGLIIKYQIRHYSKIEEEQYPSIQRKFLVRQLRRAQKDVPFYQKLLKGKNITEENCFDILKSLPVIDKKALIEKGKDVYASYVDDNWKTWHNTGGSTGEPFHFPAGGNNRFDLSRELFCQALLYEKMTGSYNIRIASIDGSRVPDKEINQNIFWIENKKNFPYGRMHLSTLYLNKETFPYYLKKLNEVKPDVMRGYPSGFFEFASLLKTTGRKLDFRVRSIYLTSENIIPEQADFISSVFNCDVWGQYGHSEASIFAIKSPNSTSYECHPLYGVTEIIKEDGTHAKEGDTGEIVVTGFQYSAMPFIRYKTGDIAEYGGVKDGVVILKRLLGRNSDFIINKERERIFLVGLIFGGHLKAFNEIDSWQIIQNKPGYLLINIKKGNTYTIDTEKEIIMLFGSKGFDVSMNYVESIPKTSRGKQQFLIQNIH